VQVCKPNLTWDPPTRWTCEASTCLGLPPDTFNGTYKCTSRIFAVGTVCESTCKPGYEEVRKGRYECIIHMSAHQWRGEPRG